ncbi:hypothetical protein CJP74_03895 [Psittacicella melopsittaci]|uniref:Luciferase-like domain-containing protein n=1 Tax=Psittacicella melopsittaci TaxID=2028576 RepID=A0A3A1Y4Y5_9GAMM|nr:TIGR03571 family LLM class oxidoreductase [Psittacicella melopsittaci]RIY32635.1 hypothetical protein CJP74_03895 [Psittacicella melopsittaci]
MTTQNLPQTLATNPAFTRVFQANKLTLGVIAPFNGYATPFPDLSQQEKLLQILDQSPVAAIWVRDVPFYDPNFGDVGQGTDPYVTLGWYSALTKNLTLGSAGIITTLRNPIHTAKSTASLDLLSHGRFVLGMASGDRPKEYAAFGNKFTNRGQRYRESWNIIRRLFSEEFPQFTSENYGKFSGDLDFYPKPKHHIPMLTIGQSRQDVAWIAQNADAWITHGIINDPAKIQENISTLAASAPDKWTPFGVAAFLDLDQDDDAPLLMERVFMKGGSKAIVKALKQLEALGVNHVTFNLKSSLSMDQEQTLQLFLEKIAVHFPHH